MVQTVKVASRWQAWDRAKTIEALRKVPLFRDGGFTETQLDCTEQSPQPSQTSSLMNTRFAGSGKVPRLRRRRFSAAQV